MPDVIRTETERLRIIPDPGKLRFFGRRRGVWLLRGRRAGRGAWARSTSLISVAATSDRTRASGCCDHRGHSLRSAFSARTRLSRTAARRPRHVWPMPGPADVRRVGRRERHRAFRPSCRTSSSPVPAVCRRRASLRVIRKGIALAGVSSAEGSFARPYNIRLHLTAPRELFYAARGERV
jgi:hypothetical protein